MIKLVVALGNPGNEYELTRHNIAWILVDSIDDLGNWKNKFKGEIDSYSVDGEKRHFLKPMTFMNLSGDSVQPACHFYKISPEEVLVIHDELDLPFGQVMFKKGGGLAGHNGLKSIAAKLGTQDFLRMRLGIGRPDRGSVSDWVLGKFPSVDDHLLSTYMGKAEEALYSSLKNGFEKAATKFSKKNLIEG